MSTHTDNLNNEKRKCRSKGGTWIPKTNGEAECVVLKEVNTKVTEPVKRYGRVIGKKVGRVVGGKRRKSKRRRKSRRRKSSRRKSRRRKSRRRKR